MFEVIMIVDDQEWPYGTYTNSDKANEVAAYVKDERNVETYVREV